MNTSELVERFAGLCEEKKWVIPREHQETIVQFFIENTLPKKEVARVIEEQEVVATQARMSGGGVVEELISRADLKEALNLEKV